jgi:hypothetical protein
VSFCGRGTGTVNRVGPQLGNYDKASDAGVRLRSVAWSNKRAGQAPSRQSAIITADSQGRARADPPRDVRREG